MNIEPLIKQALKRGIELWLDGDRLRYRARQGVMTASLKAELTAHRKEITEFLLARDKSGHSYLKKDTNTYALSHAQQRFWFMHEIEPENPAYNVPIFGRVKGRLNVGALERCLDEILSRHQVLRSVFTCNRGVLQQHVTNHSKISLDLIDVTDTKASGSESEIRKIADQALRKPFDFSRGPMLRAKVVKLDLNDYLILISTHHIVVDGWSLRQLRSEIETFYSTFNKGNTPNLPQGAARYLDYVEREQARCNNDTISRQLDYWTQTLRGISPIRLPKKRGVNTQSNPGTSKSVNIELPGELVDMLKELSRQNEATLFMTMLSAFNILLKWYSQQEDLCVATAISNRQFPGSDSVIGTFENTILLRNNLAGNPTFSELLQRTRKVLIESYANQDIPYDTLVHHLSQSSAMGPRSLYEVMFVLHEGINKIDLDGLDCLKLDAETGAAINDLSLIVNDDGAKISFNYKQDLFEDWLIKGMANHYQLILDRIVKNVHKKVSELMQLNQLERHQQLVEWNASNHNFEYPGCVHELFEKQVDATPGALAVLQDENKISYAQLNQRANQFGNYLRELGVGPGSMVGVCIDRSPDMVIAILGIWKAGGTYVPLDPDYPQERLIFMLSDARIQTVVTKASLLARLPVIQGETVVIDRDWSRIQSHTDTNLAAEVIPDNAAYVIYTSGSTGTPKGVVISHSSFSNYCQIMKDHWQISSNDRVLQLASISFDVSLAEVFIELIGGGSTVLPSGDFFIAQRLSEVISKQKVSRVNFTPALWRQWVQSLITEGKQYDFSSLRIVIVGSDTVPSDTVRIWNQLHISDGAHLVNAYGPTEATVTTTTYWLEKKQVPDVIPIGRPLPGNPHYILDSKCELVPVGVYGELHVGGACLAKGYLNQPELSAEKFLSDPFRNHNGSRMYKTGDLARYLPDGNIEFLGRVDLQVKIRGFRIELGEIEFALGQHSSIKETVVATIKDEAEDKHLVAYVVPGDGEAPTRGQIRQFLKEKLPEYMVPKEIVMIEALPLNPNGKVDRNALPMPDLHSGRPETHFVAPRNPVEQEVAGIWGEVLNRADVGIYDNFFELGGHSLNATQVISRIYDTFGVSLSIASIFNTQNLADMSKLVEQGRAY